MSLGGRSLLALEGVHPDLVKVIISTADDGHGFIVTEGRRTKARQAVLVAAGKSRTMNSRHISGHAVDLAVTLTGGGGISWDKEDYKYLAMQVKTVAANLGILVEWGGECFGPSFFDGPHFQLPWKNYPLDLSSPPDATNVT